MIFGIDLWLVFLLFSCLLLVCSFEFVNGFNDTANAIAPVIYTRALSAKKAVLLAGTLNFLGVLFGGIGVAMGIMHLLPLDIIAQQTTTFSICLVCSLLLSAICWNLTTWYFAIPSSSSHSLIGSILGVSIAMMYLPIQGGEKVSPNWHKALEVIESLLLSPVIGFTIALLLMYLSYKFIDSKKYFRNPKRDEKIKKPKLGLKSILIGASAWVSFAHGSNDGQKGVGIAMLVLISIIPSVFALNPKIDNQTLKTDVIYIQKVVSETRDLLSTQDQRQLLSDTEKDLEVLKKLLDDKNSSKMEQREYILKTQKTITSLETTEFAFINKASADNIVSKIKSDEFQAKIKNLFLAVDYAPLWVIIMISMSLGLGTMIGRKRIVKTIGEKIGDTKMNYAQATNSAIITASTITIASKLGLPVSTTHILSSSVTGSMVGSKKSNVQWDTIKHMLIAWVLTLPSTIIISGLIFVTLFKIFVV